MTHCNRPLSLMLALVLTALAAASVTAQTEPANLLANGDFEHSAGTWPSDWPQVEGVSYEVEAGDHFLRLAPPAPDKTLTVYRAVDVKPEHKAYAFTFRARATDLKPGKANWHDGRIILDFKDASGRKLPGGAAPNFKGTTKGGWVERAVELLVPEGAAKLEVMPALFSVQGGTFDVDDLRLVAIAPEPVIEAKMAAAAKKAEEVAARAARVKPQVPVATADQLPPMLRVQGNQIIDANGKPVWLQGVAIPSMEWSAGGEHILESVGVAIDDWKANVIRLPVREHFYKGAGPYQADGGAGYRQLLDDVINLAASKGAYVVIDLHGYRAPERKHAAFWTEVAARYKDHPAVLFELLNEPHDISWAVWRDGGPVSDQKKLAANQKADEPLAENDQRLVAFESVGMQGLLDAVRTTGAKNIVIAGGLDWGYDLSGIVNGYALDDRGGNGIVYSSHVYPWKSGWQKKFLDTAAKHPVFIGECGAPPERLHFIPPERHEDPSTWVPDFLGLIQQHKLHWTAWSFHPKASPVLLQDWTYTPTPYWGGPAKEALSGKPFVTQRMR